MGGGRGKICMREFYSAEKPAGFILRERSSSHVAWLGLGSKTLTRPFFFSGVKSAYASFTPDKILLGVFFARYA